LGIAFFSLMDTSGSYKNSPKISMIEDEHAKRTPAPDAIRKKIERIGLKVVLQKRALRAFLSPNLQKNSCARHAF